ncbi:MAG: hypothetical protein IIC21_10720 [Chloroflexi bacterium]|nr:hypothetical protein [Chloroflexota bacterium]
MLLTLEIDGEKVIDACLLKDLSSGSKYSLNKKETRPPGMLPVPCQDKVYKFEVPQGIYFNDSLKIKLKAGSSGKKLRAGMVSYQQGKS